MDLKTLIKELEIKNNTVKMYENTLEQMKELGSPEESIKRITEEKEIVESEIRSLLNKDILADTDNRFIAYDSKHIANEHLFKFLEGVNSEENELHKGDIENDNTATEEDDNAVQYTYYKNKDFNEVEKQNIVNHVSDEISKADWIFSRNFIMHFPKSLNIDPWRVSYFDDNLSKRCSSVREGSKKLSGQLNVIVNDFVNGENDDKFVLAMKINELMKDVKNQGYIGDIDAEIIDAQGKTQYVIRYKDCSLPNANGTPFDYSSSKLHSWSLSFSFIDIEILN